MIIKDFRHCMEIITALEESGIAKNNFDIRLKAEIAWDTHDISLVQEILDDYPGIYEEALRNIDEITAWEKREPFRPYPEGEEIEKINGQFNLGYTNSHPVGLDPLDFTQGLFICGETGSGKSYPILRLCDQILSIPPKK